MAVSLVPEHLRKPELIFEVISRGQSPEKDVKGLRGQLRECLTLERSWRESFDLDQELTECQTRIEELEDDIEGGALPLAGTARARLGSQLLHWGARLQLLSSAPDVTASISEWALKSAKRLKVALDALSDVKSLKEKGAAFQGTVQLPAPIPKTTSTHPIEPSGFAVSAPATFCAPPAFPAAPEPIAAPPVVDNGSQNRPFSGFSKLPHPLSRAFGDIPRTDGLEVKNLLTFLGKILELREYPSVTDSILMEILSTICLSPLRDRVMDCLSRGVSFDTFHAEILEFFVPARVMERLRVEQVYRPQAPAETLSRFVGEIRRVARVLRLNFSEQQLVDLILEGIKPEERSRLVFCARPTSFAELDRLSIISRGVQDADSQRREVAGHLPRGPSRPVIAPVQSGVAGQQGSHRQPPVCFGCGQRGHVRRDCRQGRSNGNSA